MDWKLYAWVKRGRRRRDILHLLASSNTPLTIKDIKSKQKIAMPQASFVVKGLIEKNLISCLNPDDKIGRLFKITKEGKQLWQRLS